MDFYEFFILSYLIPSYEILIALCHFRINCHLADNPACRCRQHRRRVRLPVLLMRERYININLISLVWISQRRVT